MYPGTGNLDIEPKFADPKGGNFYLKPRSKLHNDDPALVIGALPYDFYALADTHSKTYQPGWNMLGVPYLLHRPKSTCHRVRHSTASLLCAPYLHFDPATQSQCHAG
ncbi:MAG: hypothetical protein LRZ88_04245 [Candidatus Cloacimonetes bacterium]|nr:hypothetical protein [Candidatus Cloacimonadota bacterium]